MNASRCLAYADEAPVSEAFDIAWAFVECVYAVDEGDVIPQAFIAANILQQYEQGERRRIALANRAIAAFAQSSDPEADAARAFGIA